MVKRRERKRGQRVNRRGKRRAETERDSDWLAQCAEQKRRGTRTGWRSAQSRSKRHGESRERQTDWKEERQRRSFTLVFLVLSSQTHVLLLV
ncbi:hypothetical protein TB2_027344 [Malus domestica]